MVILGTSSKPVAFSSVTSRLDIYHLAYDHEEEKAKLPTIFSKKYFSSVPAIVILTDASGHHFEVAVLKEEKQTFFCAGWKDLGAFYGIKPGGWVQMFYVSAGHFSINVFNQWGDPVKCNIPGNVYPNGDLSHPIMLDEDPEMMFFTPKPNIVDLSHCITEFRKCLSYAEIVGPKLCFGNSWTSYALNKQDGKVNIVDEYGYIWPCVFKHNLADPNQSGITHGWSTFCHKKKLFQSQCVKFGVLHINSTVLYFTHPF